MAQSDSQKAEAEEQFHHQGNGFLLKPIEKLSIDSNESISTHLKGTKFVSLFYA